MARVQRMARRLPIAFFQLALVIVLLVGIEIGGVPGKRRQRAIPAMGVGCTALRAMVGSSRPKASQGAIPSPTSAALPCAPWSTVADAKPSRARSHPAPIFAWQLQFLPRTVCSERLVDLVLAIHLSQGRQALALANDRPKTYHTPSPTTQQRAAAETWIMDRAPGDTYFY